MNRIIKPTFDEAFRAWKGVERENCSFKSWIQPKFNFWRFKYDFYFYYEPLVYKTRNEVESELFTIGLN